MPTIFITIQKALQFYNDSLLFGFILGVVDVIQLRVLLIGDLVDFRPIDSWRARTCAVRVVVKPVLVLLELISVVWTPHTFIECREDAGGSSHGMGGE